MFDDTRSLATSDYTALEAADCAVVEMSEEDVRLFYITGRLKERGIPLLLLRSLRARSIRGELPIGFKAHFLFEYRELGAPIEIQNSVLINKFIEEIVVKQDSLSYRRERLISKVWFGREGHDIHVICPPSYDDLDSASSTSRNYIHLDKFGDKDAFLEVAVFLARTYGVRVIPYAPEEFPARQLLRDHLLIIGGPGFTEDDGNGIAREIMRRVDLGIAYQEDPPAIRIASLEEAVGWMQSEFDRAGRLVADYGVFIRMPNPFNPDRIVILIQGVHTAGVLGAAQAFTDTTSAARNFDIVERELGADNAFWFVTPMRVELVGNDVLVPRVRPEILIKL